MRLWNWGKRLFAWADTIHDTNDKPSLIREGGRYAFLRVHFEKV